MARRLLRFPNVRTHGSAARAQIIRKSRCKIWNQIAGDRGLLEKWQAIDTIYSEHSENGSSPASLILFTEKPFLFLSLSCFLPEDIPPKYEFSHFSLWPTVVIQLKEVHNVGTHCSCFRSSAGRFERRKGKAFYGGERTTHITITWRMVMSPAQLP